MTFTSLTTIIIKITIESLFISYTSIDFIIFYLLFFKNFIIIYYLINFYYPFVSLHIGHGNRPRTPEGKIATMIYAAIGIPLMMLFLFNIGNIMAKAFKCLYRYCCVCSNDDTSNNHHHNHHPQHSHQHLHDHYHVHHIALNDVSPSGHLIHCNSTGNDPYRTNKCYSTCNSTSQRDLYGVQPQESETKLCTEIPDHLSCPGTLNRMHSHHPHHSILRNHTEHSDIINSNTLQMNSESEQNMKQKPKVTVPIFLCVLLIFGYTCLGAFMFSVWEGWSFLDGVYYCFITLR